MKLSGKALRYGDHVDTDVIIPARYLNSSDPMELASHCMEDIDKDFLKRLQPGDIIAAGVNFGCGSSREHAPLAIKSAGVGAVVAKSFARIFYRNCVNIGLPIVVSNLDIAEGDQAEVDLDAGILYNQTQGTEDHFPPFSPFLQDVIHAGGLMNALKEGKL
ncbi:MAG: 3-isopropylmalate dehydratase small subunit [Eubacteriales bacterium]|jgi:3-isopropylmalate/(R)-2-methylmalate dehydratase small subunit|nr:3-isopropylmalate dehydratase small subunit [Eubacteriales bacterium]